MPGKARTQLVPQHPMLLAQESDTAHPHPHIPILYIHSLRHPFCQNPVCPCQRQRQEAARFIGLVAEGKFLFADATLLLDERVTLSDTTAPRHTRIHVDLVPGLPEECQLYGHSWELTEHPDVHECSVCHLRGYCPGCSPLAPAGAQPFSCSSHAHAGRTRQ
jgi:hypothetical protein